MSLIDTAALGVEGVMTQSADLERDTGGKDDLGARTARTWQPLSTQSCFLWWGTGAVISRMGSVDTRPEEQVDLETGGMILPAGVDVTPRDRIAEVRDEDGNVIAGSLTILAVGPFEGVTELMIRRVS